MNRRVGFIVWLILMLTIVAPIVFVMLLLEHLGVSEYVTPILMPSLISMVVVFSIVAVVLAVVTRGANQYKAALEGSTSTAFDEFTQSQTFGQTQRRAREFLMVPVHCPHCGSPVEMQHTEWIAPRRFICPACLREVDVRST